MFYRAVNSAPKILLITVAILLHVVTASSQSPFGDSATIHTRTLFDGQASIKLPDSYSLRPSTEVDSRLQYATVYYNDHQQAGVTCNLYREQMTLPQLKTLLAELSAVDKKHFKVLRKVLSEEGEDSFFILEYMQQHEYFTDKQNLPEHMESYPPKYVLTYFTIKDNATSGVHLWYDGDLNGLEEFRKLAQYIMSSYKWLNTTE